MKPGEKGISGIVAVGICIALVLTAFGVGAVASTTGVTIGNETVHITIDEVRDYVVLNDVDVDNMTWRESCTLIIDVAKAKLDE